MSTRRIIDARSAGPAGGPEQPLRRRLLAGVALAGPLAALAQSPSPRRIGLLFFGDPTPGGEPIVRHLARLGWDESRGTVAYEARFARGRRESYPALAAELSALPLDAQFTVGTDLLRALQPSASKVPVVFIVSDDPVATGLVASLARPGGRFTGVSFMSPQLAGKRLELLREIVPSLGRVAALTDAGHLGLYVPELERAAQALGVTVVPIAFEAPEEFPAAFARARASGAQAMFVVPSRYTLAYAQRIASLAVEHRIAAISAYDSFARSGGLMAYGPTAEESTERAAAMLDRVLRGAKPADMPVEQASRIELIVNKDAVAAMKLTLLPSLQARVQRWVP